MSELAWTDAEPWLTSATIVVIPLGAGAIEQGPHMKLDSDERLARYLGNRVKNASQVVVAPTLTYHSFTPYAAYPGSSSLSDTTARDLVVDVVRGFAKHGPRRFYVLNTSGATIGALSKAADVVGNDGILLGYTDPALWTMKSPALKQSSITVAHADEAATSMMLFVDPSAVDMTRAEREYARGRGSLTRAENGPGVYSKTGILGDAKLATREKGQILVDALVSGALDDIEKIRTAPLPAVRTTPPPAASTAARPPAPRPADGPRRQSGCTEGDERAIKQVGMTFTYWWAQNDADHIAGLFAGRGDIRHPDGSIERGPDIIAANRRDLFSKKEYQGSKHPVDLNDVRCLEGGAALADGKWELRLSTQPSAGRSGLAPTALNKGWCTLVLVKAGEAWMIEAWRYTVDPPPNTPLPNTLPRPGFIGRGDSRIPNP
jgi:creatinine amidohydrolase